MGQEFFAAYILPPWEMRKGGMRLVLIILLILLVLGALPAWPYSAGWGYYPSGGLGLLFIIVLLLGLTKRS
ncbi:hypothetical protein BH09VER1_BH09VER1_44450 [soil metagenome]